MNYFDLENVKLIHFNGDQSKLSLLIQYLNQLNSSFEPPLSSYVDIDSYADKLINNAYISVLEHNDRFVGLYAIYLNNINEKIAYLTSIAVLPEYKGYGFSKILMEDALNQAKEKGMCLFKLEVVANYTRAIRFYEKHGFRKCCDKSNNDQTIYMIKELNG